MIKQTLSPLAQHRSILGTTSHQQQQPLTNSLTNSVGHKTNHSLFATAADHNTSSASLTKPISSPSRSLSTHTNTLPTNIGRTNNIHYQSESNNYSLKPKPKTFTSPRVNQTISAELIEHEPEDILAKINSVTRNNSFFHALNSMSSTSTTATTSATNAFTNHLAGGGGGGASLASAANITNSSYAVNGIYGTLPKSTNAFSGGDRVATATIGSSVFGNVSAVANEFEQLIARNAAAAVSSATSATATNAAFAAGPNYNTLGSYRVQYSSTNPFLQNFNDDAIALNSDHGRTYDDH